MSTDRLVEAVKKLQKRAQADPEFFNQLVYNTPSILSNLPDDPDLRAAVSGIDPDALVATLRTPSAVGSVSGCGSTCGAASCQDTCGVSSCTSTCASSCGATCGSTSCTDTVKLDSAISASFSSKLTSRINLEGFTR